MSAETLRAAASLMREQAEAATPGPWVDREGNVEHYFPEIGEFGVVAEPAPGEGAYIASWHPAVALAVADWLEDAAAFLAAYSGYTHAEDAPLRVARAYLGESA